MSPRSLEFRGKLFHLRVNQVFSSDGPCVKDCVREQALCRGASLARNAPPPSPLGIAIPKDPTSGLCLGTFGDPKEGRRFRMTEIPLYFQDCREVRD